MDTSIVILTLVFLAIFVVPFVIVSFVNRHKARKQHIDKAETAPENKPKSDTI